MHSFLTGGKKKGIAHLERQQMARSQNLLVSQVKTNKISQVYYQGNRREIPVFHNPGTSQYDSTQTSMIHRDIPPIYTYA